MHVKLLPPFIAEFSKAILFKFYMKICISP